MADEDLVSFVQKSKTRPHSPAERNVATAKFNEEEPHITKDDNLNPWLKHKYKKAREDQSAALITTSFTQSPLQTEFDTDGERTQKITISFDNWKKQGLPTYTEED